MGASPPISPLLVQDATTCSGGEKQRVALARALANRSLRELAVGGARAALQLFAVGYALTALFAHEQSRAALPLMGLVLTGMLLAATFTAAKRVKHAPTSGSLLGAAALAVRAGSVASLAPIFIAILPGTLRENLEPRVVVPLAGMTVANAMNVVAQIFERYFAAMRPIAPASRRPSPSARPQPKQPCIMHAMRCAPPSCRR